VHKEFKVHKVCPDCLVLMGPRVQLDQTDKMEQLVQQEPKAQQVQQELQVQQEQLERQVQQVLQEQTD